MDKRRFALADELRAFFSEEEISEYVDSGNYSLAELLTLYSSHAHRSTAEVDKQFSGKYNVDNADIRFFKSFFPSAVARRSWLYLQSLLDVTFGADYFTVREGLSSYILMQTLSGGGKLVYADKEYEARMGDVFLIDCQALHDYRTSGGPQWSYRLAHFNGCAMPDYFHQIINSGNVKFHFEDECAWNSLFTKLFETNHDDRPECEILTNCILTQLLTAIIERLPQYDRNAYPQRVLDICEYLTQHCCEDLTLDGIADAFSVSKYHMSREFRKATGKTVFSYIDDARLGVAKQLLRYSDLSVSAIAEYVGFDGQTGFGRAFKKAESGITPTAFRKQWSGL